MQLEDQSGSENQYQKRSLVIPAISPSSFPMFSEINDTQVNLRLHRPLQNHYFAETHSNPQWSRAEYQLRDVIGQISLWR